MHQAITTKFLGPTNSRGSRVRATSEAGSLTVAWEHALNVTENHRAAAEKLAKKLEWAGLWYGGGTSNGFVWVRTVQGVDCSFEVP